MANTSPIIDLVGINDLQARVAALESALGYYNAANAVLSAQAQVDQTTGGSTGGTSGGTYSPATHDMASGVSGDFSLTNTSPAGFATGTQTISFGTTFTTIPHVVATPQGINADSYPLYLSTTIGNITTTEFQVRVTNLASNYPVTIRVNFIALAPK